MAPSTSRSASPARPMSTTMPSASSSRRRNSTSTTYVAPCIRCAGPNTSPEKLCAIIMWSRTHTVYISNLVINLVHDHVSRGTPQLAHHPRQIFETTFAVDERIQLGCCQQRERELQAPRVIPAGPS